MAYHRAHSETDISRAIINNWKIFFPNLYLIEEKFTLDIKKEKTWNEVDILAYNKAKKRFVIIELKKGKSKTQLSQADSYREIFQKKINAIYNHIEIEYPDIKLPRIEELNQTEIILIAESYPDSYIDEVKNEEDITLKKYSWIPIDTKKINLLLEYIHNKPATIKQKSSAVIEIKSLQRNSGIKGVNKINKIIKVFINGKTIEERYSMDTFINTIREFDFEKVYTGGIKIGKLDLLLKSLNGVKRELKNNYAKTDDYYIYRHHSTATKIKLLNSIADKLCVNINIETIDSDNKLNFRDRERIKRKINRFLDKVNSFSDIEIEQFTTEDKKMILKRFKIK